MNPTRLAPPLRRAHVVLPAALTVWFAFRAGGFFPGTTAVAAVVLVLMLVVHVTVASRPFAGWSAPLALSAAGLSGLAVWTLASASWSDAPGRALLEFDRVLLYGVVLAVMGGALARRTDLAIVLRWLLVAMLVVAVAGLLSRVLPGAFPVSENIVDERLSFPLTYWNAMGMIVGIGLLLALHVCAGPAEPLGFRLLAAAAMPLMAVTLLFTFSRGAIVLTAAGAVAYIVLARPRGLLGVLLSVGAPTAFALERAYAADLLARPAYADAAGTGEGRRVAVVVAVCAAAAVALRLATFPLDRRVERYRLPDRARRPVLAAAAAAACLGIVAVGAAADVPGRLQSAGTEFSRGAALPVTGDLRDRLTQLGNNGRVAGWNAALEGFESAPWHGTGAGTFRITWEQRRDIGFQLNDAHSLYLEVLSELGVVGLALLLVAIVPLVVAAALRVRGEARHAHAAFLAAGLALLVHAGVDWDWEMPVLFAWWFGAGAVAAARHDGARSERPPMARLPRLVAGLAVLLLALTPAAVAASQAALDGSVRAFLHRDCETAVDRALTSLSALRSRAEPFEVLGYCNARAGAGELAVRSMTAARSRDPGNWQYAYGLAVAQAIAGADPRAAAAEARRLNLLEPLAVELDRRVSRTQSRARWRRIAQRTRIPVQ